MEQIQPQTFQHGKTNRHEQQETDGRMDGQAYVQTDAAD